jgi:hypothetical protein
MRTTTLLERRAQGLSTAEALRLEEHLERCQQCSQASTLLGGLRALVDELPQALPKERRERAIEGALAQALQGRDGAAGGAAVFSLRPRPAQVETRRPVRALVGVALVAAAASVLVVVRPWSSTPSVRVATPTTTAPSLVPAGDRVLQGALEIDGQPGGRDAALSAHATLHATAPATVALAHATLALSADTTLRWDRDALRVQLDSGSVTADVDPSAHQRFSVQTARFTVLVLGTRFTVTQEGVAVERGKVRVFGPDGAVLAPMLLAGERFAAPVPTAAASTAAASTASASAAATRGSPERAVVRERARALLAQARAQLAAEQTDAARGSIGAALALARGPADRAEALSLRAECALVAGDLGGAIQGYLRVSRRYASLPAGQNALFAASRLQAERGHDAAAIALLQRYLARYPRGRFVNEAHQRLAALDPQSLPAP